MEFDYLRLHELKKRIASNNTSEFETFVKPHFLIDRKTVEFALKLTNGKSDENTDQSDETKQQIEVFKALQDYALSTAQLEWLFIDAYFFESIEYISGCTYGLSFVVDSNFNFVDVEAKFDPKHKKARDWIRLIRFVVYVDLAEFEVLSLCTSTDFSQYKDFQSAVEKSGAYQDFLSAAKAINTILSEKSMFEGLTNKVVPVLSIKAKNSVSNSKKEIKIMRSALGLLSKVLNDQNVPLEGLVLGLELLTNPDESSKEALKRDVYQNFYSWSEALPPALAVINIELNEGVAYNPKMRIELLRVLEEILTKPIAQPYFFNFCLGSFVFERIINEKYGFREAKTKENFKPYFRELYEIQQRTFDY